MVGLLLLFAIAHSGLASLRPWAEKRVGARLYRIFCPSESALSDNLDSLLFDPSLRRRATVATQGCGDGGARVGAIGDLVSLSLSGHI